MRLRIFGKEKINKLFLFISLIFFSVSAFAEPIIKVAILDNLMSQKLSSVNYERDYLKGVQTAILAEKARGLIVKVKIFGYGKEPLDILTQISSVKAWQPDFIIGPRSSDKFILLKYYFKNILVISPLATDKDVSKLPENFYSLTLPDEYSVKALFDFIKKHYPQVRSIFFFAAADCKSCSNIGDIFKKLYHKKIKSKVITRFFMADEVETLNIKELTNGYQDGDIIVTPNLSYVSAILISRITNYLARPDVTFIGGDQWGSYNISFVGKINTRLPFQAYRIIPWSLSENSKNIEYFKKYYKIKYNSKPNDLISYIAYKSIVSPLSLCSSQQIKGSRDVKITILKSFLKEKMANINIFRSNTFYVYKTSKEDESVFDTIKVNL